MNKLFDENDFIFSKLFFINIAHFYLCQLNQYNINSSLFIKIYKYLSDFSQTVKRNHKLFFNHFISLKIVIGIC